MRRYLIPLFFLLCFLAAACQNHNKPAKQNAKIDPHWKKIPANWIAAAKSFKYGKVDTNLLKQFAEIIKPDTFPGHKVEHVDPDYGLIFNVLQADIDGDRNDELICMQGLDVYTPLLCVFKQVGPEWYLIYKEDIDTFYGSPTVSLANNYSKNKTFYFRTVYQHGSDIYGDRYYFYKLIDNKVYKCLDILNETHIYGWSIYMNQEVSSKFEFRGDGEDQLYVRYDYNFFPGSINKDDCPWCAHADIPLIKGEDNVSYIYNEKEYQYKLDIPKFKNSESDLTADKIACFGDFGNDSAFIKAFKKQIDTTLKTGTPDQKRILRKYLSLVEKDKVARTRQLKLKTREGGTDFYGE